ncbi:hypothetical protein AHAS_Ahas14G0155000 [Arachis hypogaea]
MANTTTIIWERKKEVNLRKFRIFQYAQGVGKIMVTYHVSMRQTIVMLAENLDT